MDSFQELESFFEEFGISSKIRDLSSEPNLPIVPSTSNNFESDVSDDDDDDDINTEQVINSYFDRVNNYETEDVQRPSLEEVRLGCTCTAYCLDQFSNECIQENIFSQREMLKDRKEMLIMGTLVPFGNDQTRGKRKRQRKRYRYTHDGKIVCKTGFCYINDISQKTLKTLQKHISINGPVPRVHGNTGKKPIHALKYEEVKFCVDFLLTYANINGLPMPAAPRGHNEYPPVLLPSSLTKQHLHKFYTESCDDVSIRTLGLTSFKDVWKNCLPHIRIIGPRDDVCSKCELMKKKIMDATSEQEKLATSSKLTEHIQDAQTERTKYRMAIQESQTEVAEIERPVERGPPGSADLHKVHYTFDFCQNVTLPHHSQQMGPLYFVSGRKIQIFGVRLDSVSQQYNYLIDEDQSIGPDGKQTHGPNAVISMLHHCMSSFGFSEKGCVLHADNCAGQNKNRYVLAYLCWRIQTGLHADITLMMQIPGHTKCLVDGGFGHIKKLFRRVDCDSLDELAQIVHKSAYSNKTVLFNGEHGEQTWTWYDWKKFLVEYFLPLKGIQRLHVFRFSADDKDAVYVRERSASPEERVVLVKKKVPEHVYPAELIPAGLTQERQQYLFKNVRPHVRPLHQDTTCPPMTTIEE